MYQRASVYYGLLRWRNAIASAPPPRAGDAGEQEQRRQDRVIQERIGFQRRQQRKPVYARAEPPVPALTSPAR